MAFLKALVCWVGPPVLVAVLLPIVALALFALVGAVEFVFDPYSVPSAWEFVWSSDPSWDAGYDL